MLVETMEVMVDLVIVSMRKSHDPVPYFIPSMVDLGGGIGLEQDNEVGDGGGDHGGDGGPGDGEVVPPRECPRVLHSPHSLLQADHFSANQFIYIANWHKKDSSVRFWVLFFSATLIHIICRWLWGTIFEKKYCTISILSIF